MLFVACLIAPALAYSVAPAGIACSSRAACRSSSYRSGPVVAGELPTSPKELAEAASLGVQAALSAGKRRLEVSAPEGLLFFGGGAQSLGDPDAVLPAAVKAKADRELAYLVCEMFKALGDEVACVVPSDEGLAFAQKEWAKGRLQTRLVSSVRAIAPPRGKAAGFGGGGGGAGGAKGGAPRVVVVIRANKQKLAELQPLLEASGDEICCVLVNPAKLKSGGSRAGYVPAFLLRENPHPEWRGGLLYHRFGEQWLLAVAGARGGAVVHGRSAERPTMEVVDAGFAKVKDDGSLVSSAGGLLSAAGAAAALERRGARQLTLAGEIADEARKASETREPQEVLPGASKIRKAFGLDE